MKNYIYKCINCHKEYSAEKIESERIYLCPDCGSAEKNMPLQGVLIPEYDYKTIAKTFTKENLLDSTCGQFWDYPELLPLDISKFSKSFLSRLALPSIQLFEYELAGEKLLIQDETRNPTLSYKDRASSLVALKAIELGIEEIAAASTGNAGSSLAGICARLGLRSNIYVPKNIPDAKRIQIEAYGANINVVDGDYDFAFDSCLADSNKYGWYNRNTAYNPLTIEGKKSGAYDIFISLNGNLPENIFVPVGDGVIIAGIYKGFSELLKLGFIEKFPRLIAVQAEGSDAVVRYLKTGKFEYKPANTIADSISAGAPRNLYMAADAVKATNGSAVSVSDVEILSAQKEIANRFGILSEPSSAAVFAGYLRMKQNKSVAGKSNLLIITGNGLKDVEALKKWI
jgi:threonine synthase